MRYRTILTTGPSIEPITLAEAKSHLRIDSSDIEANTTSYNSIVPNTHGITASYGIVGDGVDVLAKDALVYLSSGACGSGGSIDSKIQESDDDSSYTDWSDGAFTQVTESNDNSVQEIEYTGIKQYIRVVATVSDSACSFGASVVTSSTVSTEDDLISGLITFAREHIENITNRKLITQTWKLYLDDFPCCDGCIELPYANLQSVDHVKYTGADDTEYTLSTDYYSVDTASTLGRVVLRYEQSWPTTTLSTTNPIEIQFVCGYGDDRIDVPKLLRQYMLVYMTEFHENRGYGPDVDRIDSQVPYRIRGV